MTNSRHFSLLIGLGVFWILLSGHYNSLLLSLGALSCLLSYLIYQKIFRVNQHRSATFNPIKQLNYTGWLLVEIVKANFLVMAAILDTKKVSAKFFEVEADDLNEIEKVIYANSITLTPGTVSTRVGADKIQVHGLTKETRLGLSTGNMRLKVKALSTNDGDHS